MSEVGVTLLGGFPCAHCGTPLPLVDGTSCECGATRAVWRDGDALHVVDTLTGAGLVQNVHCDVTVHRA